MLTPILLLPLAYVIGSVPSGYLLVRWKLGRDVRECGSRGVGAINVWRAGGVVLGAATLLADTGKGMAIVVGAAWAQAPPWAIAACIVLVVLGQICSIWFLIRERRVSGGKGVACCLGALIGLAWIGVLPPLAALAPVCLWALCLVAPRVVIGRWPCISPATMIATAAMPAIVWAASPPLPYVVGIGATAALILARHRGNIRQLRAKTEPRLGERARPEPGLGRGTAQDGCPRVRKWIPATPSRSPAGATDRKGKLDMQLGDYVQMLHEIGWEASDR
jgi:glycerol-3-phosphate acyltransferase PlsY